MKKISEFHFDVCPYCNKEVRLVNDEAVQKCPECGKDIVTIPDWD